MQFQQALERVRAGADVMPQRQLEKVIAAEAGPNWRSKVASFEDEPLAAASIGQVNTLLLYKLTTVSPVMQDCSCTTWTLSCPSFRTTPVQTGHCHAHHPGSAVSLPCNHPCLTQAVSLVSTVFAADDPHVHDQLRA